MALPPPLRESAKGASPWCSTAEFSSRRWWARAVDQKAGWGELLREVADAAAGEMLAKTGVKCRVEKFEQTAGESKASCAFLLSSGDRAWPILVEDEVRPTKPARQSKTQAATDHIRCSRQPQAASMPAADFSQQRP